MRVVYVFAGVLQYKGRLLKQIVTLQEAGHECILIHGQVEDEVPDYSKYTFQVHRISLIRCKNKFRNFYNHIRFNCRVAKEISKIAPEAVVCVELYSAFSGALAKKRNSNLRFIFDCNELFMHMGMGSLKQLVWYPIHALVFQKADVVMHAEEQRMSYSRQHYNSSATHILLKNLPNTTELDLKDKRLPIKPLKVVYIGAFLPDRSYEELISAFTGISPDTASCDLIGFGDPAYEKMLKELIDKNNLNHVHILPPVSHDKLLSELVKYDIGLAFYENRYLNQYYCAPNKIYDYIACGLPVITNDYPGLKRTLEDNSIGVCVSEVTTKSIKESLEKILSEEIAVRITPDIRRRFSWEYQTSVYCALFE